MVEYQFEGRWEPPDRAEALYRRLPFDLPANAPGLVIDVEYQKTATAALDVGLSDPSGFRGWSGSSRKQIHLAQGRATPGYVAGDLPAGTWAVELGLHRIPAEGLPYRIRVATERVIHLLEPRTRLDAAGRQQRTLPAPDGMRWMAGDTRAHSEHSDGTESIAALAERALRTGLDFLVIADFNTVSHYAEIAAINAERTIVLIPAQTIATDAGHAVALGIDEWIDLRADPRDWTSTVRSKGGMLSVNHPVKSDAGWVAALDRPVDVAEVWSGDWNQHDRAALAWWVAAGHNVVPVGGSGWTGTGSAVPLGRPTTWVLTEQDDVLAGIRAGRTAISVAPDGPLLLPAGAELIALNATGLTLVHWDGRTQRIDSDDERFPLPEHPSYLRDGELTVAVSGGRSTRVSESKEAH